jgi:hypothetical protein
MRPGERAFLGYVRSGSGKKGEHGKRGYQETWVAGERGIKSWIKLDEV